MEKYCIVGIQFISFKGTDGNLVEGFKIHCTYENKNIDGVGVMSQFVKELPSGLNLGDCITLTYNRYGKVTNIQLVND